MRKLKCLLIIGSVCMLVRAQGAHTMPSDLLMPSVATAQSQGLVVKENPHSKGIGQRVVGGVLVGTGVLSMVLGAALDVTDVYADTYEDINSSGFGDGLEKAIWIEGIIRFGIGLPFLITGYANKTRHDEWEKENGSVSLEFQGAGLVLTF